MLTVDELVRILWRRRLVFAVTFLVALAGAAAVTFSMKKQYATTAYLYVSAADQTASSFDQVQISQVTTKTYAELLQTRNAADAVAKTLPFPMSGKAVLSAVSISPVSGSALVTLTATASSPQRAQVIANAYATTFVSNASSLASGNLGTTRITLAEPATLMTSPVRPRPKLYMLIGAIVAAFIATGAALLRHRTDQHLEFESSATEINGLPVLGRIPRIPAGALSSASLEDLSAPAARQGREAFHMLFANLAFANNGHVPRTLAVASASQSEGKSTICTQLAHAAAERGINTLLIDADLRRGRLISLFDLDPRSAGGGLSSLLLGLDSTPLAQAVAEVGDHDVKLLPSGPVPPNPAALLGSQALRELVREASERYGLVIVDTPPISVGADASLVSAAVDGVVLVVDLPSTHRSTLAQATNQLAHSQAKVLGVVVNRAAGVSGSYDYYYSGTPQNGQRTRRWPRVSVDIASAAPTRRD